MLARLVAVVAALASTCAAAQRTPSEPPQSPAQSVAAEIARLEARKHVGTPREALVGLEVRITTPDGAQTTVRHGNGFVLRCDGFILAPYSLYDAPAGYSIVTDVHFHPGFTDLRVVKDVVRPWYMDRATGLVAFRVPSIHAPSARTLLAAALKAEADVELLWSPWDAARKAFGKIVSRPARLAAAKQDAPALPVRGSVELEALPEDALEGALVVGPEDMLVGLAPGKTKPKEGAAPPPPHFVSFEQLHRATNCAGPVPVPDSAFAGGEGAQAAASPPRAEDPAQAAAAPKGMVLVPGGPLWLPPDMVRFQPDMQTDTLACVPPFRIDAKQVTNAEYYEFWRALPDKVRLAVGSAEVYFPLSWADDGEPFGPDVAELPVLGVTVEAAMAYARWKGKRLPTPCEMARAAYGPRPGEVFPDWARDMLQERAEVCEQVWRAHRQYTTDHPSAQWGSQGFWCYPFIAEEHSDLYLSGWSRSTLDGMTLGLWQRWNYPSYVVAVGHRPFDVGPTGMLDAMLNAAHLVLPPPWLPPLGRQCYLVTEWQAHIGKNPPPCLTEMRGEKLLPKLPASRLLCLHLPPPESQYLAILTNLYDALQIMWPVDSLGVRMVSKEFDVDTFDRTRRSEGCQSVGDPLAGFTLGPADYGRNDHKGLRFRDWWAGYSLWIGYPTSFRREMGRPTAFDNPKLRLPARLRYLEEGAHKPPAVVYLFPGGFRCAR